MLISYSPLNYQLINRLSKFHFALRHRWINDSDTGREKTFYWTLLQWLLLVFSKLVDIKAEPVAPESCPSRRYVTTPQLFRCERAGPPCSSGSDRQQHQVSQDHTRRLSGNKVSTSKIKEQKEKITFFWAIRQSTWTFVCLNNKMYEYINQLLWFLYRVPII